MIRLFPEQIRQLDSVYRDQPYFVGVKARLLTIFNLLLLAFVPVNLVKLFLVQPPYVLPRLAFSLFIGLAALLSLRWIRRGRLELAGSGLTLGLVVPAHGLVFLAGAYLEPLSGAVQLFAMDFVFVLLAVVFASRWWC